MKLNFFRIRKACVHVCNFHSFCVLYAYKLDCTYRVFYSNRPKVMDYCSKISSSGDFLEQVKFYFSVQLIQVIELC